MKFEDITNRLPPPMTMMSHAYEIFHKLFAKT
jgi:hypothetical protein